MKADEERRAKRNEYNREHWKKRQAEKPPKPLSQHAIIKRHYEGLPLTDEEYAIYRAWQDKRTAQNKEWRYKQKEKNTA